MKNHQLAFLLTSRFLMLLAILLAGGIYPSQAAIEDSMLSRLEKEILERRYFSSRRTDFRDYAVATLLAGAEQRGLHTLTRYFEEEFEKPRGQLSSHVRRQNYTQAADAWLLLNRAQKLARAGLQKDPLFTQWLFNSNDRLALFIDTVSVQDNWPAVLNILHELYTHDPQGRDRFFKLILALAVVWDQPRPPMHPQMGTQPPAYQLHITQRYDYYKELYGKRQAKVAFNNLTPTTLTFVVDAPVPVAELEWARENVRGSARDWEKKFFDIRYVEERVQRGVYVWPHGSYTLADIENRGGICVDQGYYATITARAHGIPALFFFGHGRRGPHAWFGYLRDSRHWEMDTGRYEYDNYGAGHATNPQTNQLMTDHEVKYVCEQAVRPTDYQDASGYCRVAAVLLELGRLDAALEAAERSLREVNIYGTAWEIKAIILAERGEHQKLLKLFDEKAHAFRDYPDFVATIRRQQANVLRQLGRDDEADRLLRLHERRLGNDRDDLERVLVSDQIDAAYKAGNMRQARGLFEDLLQSQRDEGAKLIPMIQAYIQFTRHINQQVEAAQFMGRYINRLKRRYSDDRQTQVVLLSLLLKAYENAEDEWRINDVRKQLQKAASP